jgi:hypothetical protein
MTTDERTGGDGNGDRPAGRPRPAEPLNPTRAVFGDRLAGSGAALIAELRRLQARQMPAERAEPETRCELCGVEVAPDHRHLLQTGERRIVCVCETCWAVRAGDGDYRPTGRRAVWLDDFELPDELWARLGVPIGLALFFDSAPAGRVIALYPSPAGATESELPLDAWEELVAANPVLADLETDSEALLVDRISKPAHYALAPIDEAYRLIGTVRASWEGISGGPGVAEALTGFFAALRERATGR